MKAKAQQITGAIQGLTAPGTTSLPSQSGPISSKLTGAGFVDAIDPVVRIIGRSGHLVVSIGLILILSYVIGRAVLVGPIGNDAPLHVSYAYWLDQWFPEIPEWYPLHGGGISIQRAYPMLSHWSVVWIHELFSLSIVQSFHLLTFLSITATAVGIYLLCWSALDNQTAGLIGAILFLLSPIAWTWIYEQGYLAYTVASAGVPFALLCFDRYLTHVLADSQQARRRLWFAATVIISTLTTLSHLIAGSGIAVGMILYTLFLTLVGVRGERRALLRKAGRATIACGLVWAGLIAFWAVPIYFYGLIANRDGLNTIPSHLIVRFFAGELFGITPFESLRFFANMSFPPVLGGLFLLGVIVSGIYSRKALAFGLIGLTTIVYVITPEIRAALTSLVPFSQYLSSSRAFLVLAEVMLPATAGYGVWAVAISLVLPLRFARRLLRRAPGEEKVKKQPLIAGGIAALLALILASLAIYQMRNISDSDPWRARYGLARRGFDIRDVWRTGTIKDDVLSQFQRGQVPPFYLPSDDPSIESTMVLAKYLPMVEPLRIDISPYLGRYSQNLVSLSTASQINTYNFNANLMHAMWGYQQNVFYSDEEGRTEYGTPTTLNETADWFGIGHSFIRSDEDSSNLYKDAGWEQIVEDGKLELWRYPESKPLATVSSQPTVLVMSKEDIKAYEHVFRIGTLGAFPYDEFWLVQGRENVDSYSLDELQMFDAVLLHGYSYKDSEDAWLVLEEYVRQGGALYVDTGWQWTVPEWEFQKSPAVLPVSSIVWTDYGATEEYALNSPAIAGDVDIAEFAPLAWEGMPWGVSGTQFSEVRNWGEVVLSASGRPLVVAGLLDEGRVVWSGMNLIAHAIDKDSGEEVTFLNNMMKWLVGDKKSVPGSVKVSREHPDHVVFSVNSPNNDQTALYWREAFYPDWHAYAEFEDGSSVELPILRAGPGFMFIPIEANSENATIDLVWERPLTEKAANIASMITALGLASFVLDGLLFEGRWFRAIGVRIRRRKSKAKPQGSIAWLELPETNENID